MRPWAIPLCCSLLLLWPSESDSRELRCTAYESDGYEHDLVGNVFYITQLSARLSDGLLQLECSRQGKRMNCASDDLQNVYDLYDDGKLVVSQGFGMRRYRAMCTPQIRPHRGGILRG
jgi:hypothetical protein